MSANPLYITQPLVPVECPNAECGITFGVPERLEQELRRSHKSFYCPHGHVMSFKDESDMDKAERLRKEADWRATVARSDAERHRKEKIAIRVRHFNLKQRIKRGKCPVKGCKEKFLSVKEHLQKHRNWRKR